MLRALDGDAAAYRALLDALRGPLLGFYRRRLGAEDAGEADDLVQETLIAIHGRRATFDPSQPFTAWAYAIARYKLIDHLRRRRRRRAVPIDDVAELFAADQFEAAMARHDVDKLLATLPERPRRMIRDTKLEGYSNAEAAARLGSTDVAVKVGVHRGLKRLAARLQGKPEP